MNQDRTLGQRGALFGTSRFALLAATVVALTALAVGCSSKPGSGQGRPVFTLFWSEYPSWSAFGVAAEKGLLDGSEGGVGPVEEQWGVDIKLQQTEYELGASAFESKGCDAVCLTNLDALKRSFNRPAVAVLPTSTSAGADALLVVDIPDVEELRNHKVFGLTESVSQYVFVRNLEKLGKKEADYQFVSTDPDKAALLLQTPGSDVRAVMTWNPYALQTLKVRKDARVLFDSSSIPDEVVDLVVVGKDVLAKPGGKEFACALGDTFYRFNDLLADKARRDEMLTALGAKFGHLNRDDMKKALEQTRFYRTPDEALDLLTGERLAKVMKTVSAFGISHKMFPREPRIGYGAEGEADLRFDPSYIQAVKERKK
jgi:NitT/TauT family transport system substrate-binding protein